jgi:hypothetical protein
MPAGHAMPKQEIKVTITHHGRQAQADSTEQKPPVKLPSSWPPQTPQEAAATAATIAALTDQPSWWENRVVVGTLVLVAALLLYFIVSRINRQYKRQWLRKLRQVPGFSAVSDGNTHTDLVSLIDQRTSSPVFQCFFIAGAASVGFIWPHWDWMVLLVVILQHVLLRLLGFAFAAACILGHAAAQRLWQLLTSGSGIWFWGLRGLRWLGSWVKHGDVAVLVTADSLDCSACSDLDDGLRLHSSDSTGSSCSAGSASSTSSAGSTRNTRQQQQQQRSRKNKAHKSSSSSSSMLSLQQGSKQGSAQAQEPSPTAAAGGGNSNAAAASPKASSAAAQPAATMQQPEPKQRSAKPAAAAAPSKAACTQTASPIVQLSASPVSPSGVDAKRRVSSGNSSSSRDQTVGASDTKCSSSSASGGSGSSSSSSSSAGKNRKDKGVRAAGGF